MAAATAPSRAVLVLDREAGVDSLSSAIEAAGFSPTSVSSIGDLQRPPPGVRVAAVAFESLWPNPQETLKELRERVSLKLVAFYTENSPRLRLGNRLWESGLIDFFAPRSIATADLGYVLRQALADASTEAVLAEPVAAEPRSSLGGELLPLVTQISASFGNHRSEAALIRELHLRLPGLVRYRLLLVSVKSPQALRLYQLPRQAVPHGELWSLALGGCAKLSEAVGETVTPESLEFIEPTAIPADVKRAAGPTRSLHVPLQTPSGPLGVLSALVEAEDEGAEAGLKLVAALLSSALKQVHLLEAAEAASLVDELTGCGNRRGLTEMLGAEWKRSTRYGLQLSVAVLEIDRFRELSALHGHVVADRAIREFSDFVLAHLRDTDYLARHGRAEFVAVLPETGPADAAQVLERIRLVAGGRNFGGRGAKRPFQLTFSAGVAGIPASPAGVPDDLIHEADRALTQARQDGMDRVHIAAIGAKAVATTEPVAPSVEELREFPRIPTRMKVRLLEIPDFERNMARATAADISAGGLAIELTDSTVKKNAYALVYLEEAQKPLLTRVVWTRDTPSGSRRAGLQFVDMSQLNALARGEVQQSARHALVMVSTEQVKTVIGRVLRAAQYEAVFIEDAAHWPQTGLEAFGLIVLGDTTLRDQVGAKLAGLERAKAKTRIVVVNESGDRRQALGTIASHQVRHLVPTGQNADEALFATLNKLLLGEYFGIRKYLLWGARSRAWEITDAEGKNTVLSGVRAIAEEVQCHPRVIDLLMSAVDEMMINALYRAPPSGNSIGEKPVAVECGSDGRLLVVSVLDEHGRLRPEEIYAGLGRALAADAKTISADASHAHLGFQIMLDALSQLAVNVDPGVRTEIVGIVDLRKSLREHRQSVPTFNVFSTKE